jgi:type I restriction enzyme S subunit
VTDLPEGWEWKTIGEVADVSLGRQRSPQHHSGPNMRPYLRSANVTWRGIDTSDVKQMNFDAADRATFELRPGDLLLNEASGSPNEVGKPAIWRGEIEGCCFQNTLLRVRTRRPIVEYLYWYCMFAARKGRFGEAGRGVNIRHLGKAGLTAFPIPVPPLDDQVRIVAAIEEHLSRVDAASRLVEVAAERSQRLMAPMVQIRSSPMVRLGSVAATITKGTTPTSLGFEYTCSGIRFVKAESLQGGRVRGDRCAWIDAEADEALRRSRLAAEDLLVTIAGTLGRIGRVETADLPANTNQAVAIVRIPNHNFARFLWRWLRSPDGQAALTSGSRGVGLQNLNLAYLRALEVPAPTAAAMERFNNSFDAIGDATERLRLACDRGLKRAEQLRRSVLTAAFSGSLV